MPVAFFPRLSKTIRSQRECLALVWAIAKFRPYLYSRPFTVITDHHALCWLSSLKDPTGRFGRWALRLQEHSYTVVYKSGRLHQDADCLSRYTVDPPDAALSDSSPCVLSISQLFNTAAEQRLEASLRKIIENLHSQAPDPSLRLFVLQNDTLYRRSLLPDGPDLL